jgi:hypothetical protein
MTITELQSIINENAEGAEAGDSTSQRLVVNAQAEIDRLEREAEEATRDEWCEGAGIPVDPFTEAIKAVRHQRDEQFEADMLDLAGCSDPYAPMRPSDYGD